MEPIIKELQDQINDLRVQINDLQKECNLALAGLGLTYCALLGIFVMVVTLYATIFKG